MNIFKRIFGRKPKSDTNTTENTVFHTSVISKADFDNLKVGSVINLDEEKEEILYEAVWIDANENPYNVRIFDCREYALKMISTTSNQEIIKKFLELRNSDGKEHISTGIQLIFESLQKNSAENPNKLVKARVDFEFVTKGKQLDDGILFKAKKMEEKWDIYKYEDLIYFAESWTGELVYISNYIPTEIGFRVDIVMLDGSKIDENDISFEFNVVQFLIYSHVLGYVVPHPLPKNLENDKTKIINYSFSMFGNRGLYASYE